MMNFLNVLLTVAAIYALDFEALDFEELGKLLEGWFLDQMDKTCPKESEICSSPWQLAYHHDSDGVAVDGWKFSLVSAVQSGARVRVVINDKYSAEADNVKIYNGNVFAQLLQHVSKASWETFQDDAYWWWLIVSTDGLMQMTRYNVGSNLHRGTNSKTNSIKWYVQRNAALPNSSYSHLADGTRVQGSLNSIKSSVMQGHDIRCVSHTSYLFPLQNVAVDDSLVSGQALDHISQESSNNILQFQSNAYWWFTMVTTSGTRDMSRWSVGTHEDRGHSDATSPIEWFADSCWEEIFSHDTDGSVISGSLNSLTSAVLSGHRVRFQIPDWNFYTAEADNLSVRNGHVTAQAIKHVSKAGLSKFQDDAYWWWLMVSSTGTVRATRYNVGEHTHRGNTEHKLTVKWFVDTRPWVEVLSNDADGSVITGSRSNLVDAVVSGKDVRCVQGNEESGYAYKAQNLLVAPDGQHVGAQTLNHVSMMPAPNKDEVMIQPNAYWWFTIVSTTGSREMSRWTVGEHEDRGHTADTVGQTWFVNY